MLDDVKVYNGKLDCKGSIRNMASVRIVRCFDMKSLSNKYHGYVLKLDNEFNFYLSEIPLVNHEYNYMDNICFLYDEMSEKDQERYKDKVINAVLRDRNIAMEPVRPKVKKLKK